jgi:hypothetical protein
MEIVAETKVCKKCGVEKAIEEFHIDRANPDGRKYRCRKCYNQTKASWRKKNSEKVIQGKKDSYWRHRDKYLAYNRSTERKERWFRWKLNHMFGITLEQYEAMMDEQSGCCAICEQPPGEANGHRYKLRLHVDHDHNTGNVRGLLCNCCNAALGYLRDDPERAMMAYEYLTTRQNGITNEASS